MLKKLCILFLICNSILIFSMDNSPWFSPSTMTNWIKNTWIAKQLGAVATKTTSAMEQESKWSKIYHKKETISKTPITKATESAQKFKEVLHGAAVTNPSMSHFLGHPEKFLFGASSSSYQYEGGLDVQNEKGVYRNANAQFYSEKGLPLADDAIDFWNRYENDIQQMKNELGINSFRLSIAWDRVAPEKDQWDQDAINHYVQILLKLKQYNIEPIVVLHHYTVPTWFQDIGGFEKEENIDYFVQFAEQMYEALYKYVIYWSTFNAIEGYAFKGYKTLDGPPGKTASLALTQQVMANMLEAHVRIYQKIKGPNGLYYTLEKENSSIPNPQIGIQKNIVILDPVRKDIFLTDALVQIASAAISVIGEGAQNKGFFDFFTTGTFNVYTPKQIYHQNLLAPKSIDWIGLNIYSNMLMRFMTPQEELNEDKATANKTYRDYPEGIYRAVEEIYKRIAEPLNIPIIITENGIATDDDNKRTRFFQRTLFTIRMLIKEGYPIIGYTPWASHDNYEWPSQKQPDAFTKRRYGFFYVDFDKQSPDYLKRTLKPGAYYYRNFIKSYFSPKIIMPTIEPWKE